MKAREPQRDVGMQLALILLEMAAFKMGDKMASLSSATRLRPLVLVLVLVGGSGCFYAPFVRNDGPVQSNDVEVSLEKHRCAFEPAWTRPDHSRGDLDLLMRLAIKNGTPQTATVDPKGVHLLGEVGTAEPFEVGAVQQLAPAETKKVDVRFRQRGGEAGCRAPMVLSFDKFVQIAGTPVQLRPVSFTALKTRM